jgi:hypothetical protein
VWVQLNDEEDQVESEEEEVVQAVKVSTTPTSHMDMSSYACFLVEEVQ